MKKEFSLNSQITNISLMVELLNKIIKTINTADLSSAVAKCQYLTISEIQYIQLWYKQAIYSLRDIRYTLLGQTPAKRKNHTPLLSEIIENLKYDLEHPTFDECQLFIEEVYSKALSLQKFIKLKNLENKLLISNTENDELW
jgi:hypothetical protein